MNHRPFEDWLLEKQTLSSRQSKELDDHLKQCTYCSALVKVEQLLTVPIMAAPSSGFSDRFQVKLAAEKLLRRKRMMWGFGLFVLLAFILTGLIGFQILGNWTISPSELLLNFVTWIIGFSATVRTFGSVGMTLLNILLGTIPLPIWVSVIAGSFLLVLLWIYSLWRLSYSMQARRLT